MDLTQAQLNAKIDAAAKKYTNAYVVDQQGGYKGECLSLVKKVYGDDILHVQMPGAVNGYDWADGYSKYYSQSLPLPTYFNHPQAYKSGTSYPKGSLVIYAATHHIAILLQSNGNGTHTVFEQNADPDHSPAHINTRADSRATSILTPKVKGEAREMITRNGLSILYRFRLGRSPDTKAIKGFVGKATFDEADAHVRASKEYKDFVAKYRAAKTFINNQLPTELK